MVTSLVVVHHVMVRVVGITYAHHGYHYGQVNT